MSTDFARIPGTTPTSPTPRPAYGGKRRIMNSVKVNRLGSRATFSADAGELSLRRRDTVVVDTEAGLVLCEVVDEVRRSVVEAGTSNRVVRVAGEADLADWERSAALAEQAAKVAVRATKRLKIAAKIVTAEVPLDRSNVHVFYSAENRIDVRKLAKAVAAEVSGRVQLRSVGVREGAGVVGGIGACGGELCCSTFLTRFSSVSVRFAKAQSLSLNPGRITGMCGRLKCCLVYEEATYKEMKSYAPRKRNGAFTPKGGGNILDVDTVNRTVLVRLHGGLMETFHVRDIRVMDRPLTDEEIKEAGPGKEQTILNQRRRRRGDSSGKMSKQAASVLSEDYIWDDTEGSATITEQSAPKKKRRRKRRKGGAPAGGRAPNAQQKPANAAAQDGSGDQPPKKRRRRRRRGGRGRSGGGGSQGGGSEGGGSQGGSSGGGE